MLKLQFLTGKKHNEEWSTVKNCNFSKLQFFKCTFTVISLHIFAVQGVSNTIFRQKWLQNKKSLVDISIAKQKLGDDFSIRNIGI